MHHEMFRDHQWEIQKLHAIPIALINLAATRPYSSCVFGSISDRAAFRRDSGGKGYFHAFQHTLLNFSMQHIDCKWSVGRNQFRIALFCTLKDGWNLPNCKTAIGSPVPKFVKIRIDYLRIIDYCILQWESLLPSRLWCQFNNTSLKIPNFIRTLWPFVMDLTNFGLLFLILFSEFVWHV